MTKYILCVLLGAFLMLGFNHVLNQDLQEFRTETGSKDVQSYNKPDDCVSMPVSKLLFSTENPSIRHETANYTVSDGIIGSFFFSRTFSPSKTLKLNTSATVVKILSCLDSNFPEKKWNRFAYDTNPTKDSYRYFIYTLKRILI